MDTGLKVSLGGHAALLAVALVGWPFGDPRDAEPPASVSVTLVAPSDLPAPGQVDPPAAPEMGESSAALTPPDETAPAPAASEPDTAPDASAPAPPPPPVDRVAPVPQPEPPEPVAEGERVQPEIVESPDPAPDAVEEEAQQATAPEAAAPQIVTEATETSEAPEVAPTPRPQARPARPAPEPDTPDPAPEAPVDGPAPPPDPAPDTVQDAADAALADVLAAQTQADAPRPQAGGPPLSRGEREGLRVAVSRCWNVGALSTDAAQVTVTVGMDMARDGSPSNLRLVSQSGGSDAAGRQAFDTARRAILRCAPFSLPQEKYEQWRSIEMTFNPEEMRRR